MIKLTDSIKDQVKILIRQELSPEQVCDYLEKKVLFIRSLGIYIKPIKSTMGAMIAEDELKMPPVLSYALKLWMLKAE